MHTHSLRTMAVLLLLLCCLTVFAGARELTVEPDVQFCFSSDDFLSENQQQGVFLTAVPHPSVAKVWYGGRLLRAGDALPREALDQLTLESCSTTRQTAAIDYHVISEDGSSAAECLNLSILPKKNEPPEAEDAEFETYKNLPIEGTLEACDPENGPLTYQVVREPKRGTVEIREDGTFTYTPDENKVGKDKFIYTVTDDAGQVSEPEEVEIEILKPTDKRTYADMTGDEDAFSAMWMKEQGLFTGTNVGENLCFEPDASVSRGQFLVMAMKLVGAEACETGMTSGFSDEAATPLWMQPYIVSALSNGMISGTPEEGGMTFRPTAELTHAESAVMMQNILQLPGRDIQAVSSLEEQTLPVWAQEAAAALNHAGVELDMTTGEEILTRRDAAKMLYQVSKLLEADTVPTFYWVK